MAYQLGPETRSAMTDAIRGVNDALDEFEHIENACVDWGTPDVELAVVEARRASTRVIATISNWIGATPIMAESGRTLNPFVWLEHITIPNGHTLLDLSNTAQEIVTDLFIAHRLYMQGDTLKALDRVNQCYTTWGPAFTNALIGAMRVQLLGEPIGLDPRPRGPVQSPHWPGATSQRAQRRDPDVIAAWHRAMRDEGVEPDFDDAASIQHKMTPIAEAIVTDGASVIEGYAAGQPYLPTTPATKITVGADGDVTFTEPDLSEQQRAGQKEEN